MQLTQPLNEVLDKHISHLCPFSLGQVDRQNHCAHFVSHMLSYDFGETCKNFTLQDRHREEKGATIRVNRLFDTLPRTGHWDERPHHLTSCLVFVTLRSNVVKLGHKLRMNSRPTKHVGLLLAGLVWNYSNLHDRIVADTEQAFFEKFRRAYRTAGDTVEFYYGEFM